MTVSLPSLVRKEPGVWPVRRPARPLRGAGGALARLCCSRRDSPVRPATRSLLVVCSATTPHTYSRYKLLCRGPEVDRRCAHCGCRSVVWICTSAREEEVRPCVSCTAGWHSEKGLPASTPAGTTLVTETCPSRQAAALGCGLYRRRQQRRPSTEQERPTVCRHSSIR